MSSIIIGHTGVVGKTICDEKYFDLYFNTKNIEKYKDFVKNGDDLILTCLPAQKWQVNKNITSDIENIIKIVDIISHFNYNRITLISTIDIYLDCPLLVDESYDINIKGAHYGTNRYLFELLVHKINYNDLKIFRLPGLFNKNINKNIIYDLIYGNNLDKINRNSSYQWYNLDNIVSDIENLSIEFKDKKVINLFTEPLETTELLNIFDLNDCGYLGVRNDYNFKTKYRSSGYFYEKEKIIQEIKNLKYELMS